MGRPSSSSRGAHTLQLLAIATCALAATQVAARAVYFETQDGSIDQHAYSKYYYQPHVQTLTSNSRPTPEAYDHLRDIFFSYEESKALGSDIELNAREQLANEQIMQVKRREYEEGLIVPHLFKPSQHIFSVLEQISASPLFTYMSELPKGGALHAHDTALCSTDYVIELTYRPNLWVCQASSGVESVALKFSKLRPTEQYEESCSWQLLSQLRQTLSAEVVDDYLRDRFSLYPTQKFLDINVAWQEFSYIFGLLDGLLLYAPVWKDYYYNALKEFQADGVQYLEFRTTLPRLYDLDGTNYTELDTVRIYTETLKEFMSANPNFIGSKLIYAPLRHTDDAGIAEYIRICTEIKEKYPDFVAGFDLVGQEELGRPLKELVPLLLTLPDHIDFYFHAGETNWHGSSVDENVIDAVLLGTKRIGHGFALLKHPLALQMLKQHNIAVEVNPVSNQVLQLVADLRNHPCSHLFSDNYPVVISSDDPSFWMASPLSHDYYVAFLGIASAHADLRLLKKLALNSLQYSSLTADQKAAALNKWQQKWNAYIEYVITGEKSAAGALLPSNRLD